MEQRALELFIKLAHDHPRPLYTEHIGWASRNLGEIARRSEKLDEARKHYESAVEAFSGVAGNQKIPQRDGWYRNWEADTLIQLAQVLGAAGHMQEAADAARRSVEICEALVTTVPAQWRVPFESTGGRAFSCRNGWWRLVDRRRPWNPLAAKSQSLKSSKPTFQKRISRIRSAART